MDKEDTKKETDVFEFYSDGEDKLTLRYSDEDAEPGASKMKKSRMSYEKKEKEEAQDPKEPAEVDTEFKEKKVENTDKKNENNTGKEEDIKSDADKEKKAVPETEKEDVKENVVIFKTKHLGTIDLTDEDDDDDHQVPEPRVVIQEVPKLDPDQKAEASGGKLPELTD